MQSPPDPLNDETPYSTPLPSTCDQPISPTATTVAGEIDPLVAQIAKKLADVINDFKRELDKRDSLWATATGAFELALKTDQSHTYRLSIVQDEDGDAYPVTIHTMRKKNEATNEHGEPIVPLTSATSSATYRSARRDSDSELEKDIISRKKRKLDEGENLSRKKLRTDKEEEHIMSLVSKGDLDDLFAKLREDIQDDTSECVNHVQRLLRRFKEEWHEKTKWEDEQLTARHTRSPFRDSVVGVGTTPGTFPSPSVDKDDQSPSLPDVIRSEARLLSSQIRWVEECRRVASEIHDKREENWRTSSAGFHDRSREDRETFQNRVLQESTMQGRMLNQILNEVKAIGLYAQSMKWETPSHLTTSPIYPPAPTAPTLSVQAAPTSVGRGRGAASNKR